MKLSLILLLGSLVAFGNTNSNWTPKYKKLSKKKISKQIDKKVLKSKDSLTSLKKVSSPLSSRTDSRAASKSNSLEKLYQKASKTKKDLARLKKETMLLKQKAVPTLLKVMKEKKYPDENRWVATYMLGRIMGVKAAPLISKYSQHPNWMLRLASLKVLLHLNQKQYKGIYAKLLNDKSLIVRHQALQNIKKMEIKELAPYVWKMLYNKKNYVGLKGKRKRSNIIKDAIKTVGDLDFKQARKPMLKMFQKNKYKDVFEALDYSLSKLSKKNSPDGPLTLKKHYWNQTATSEVKI